MELSLQYVESKGAKVWQEEHIIPIPNFIEMS